MKNSDSNNLYINFFELSLDLMCTAGFDGYLKTINPVWKKLLGYSEKELLSKPFLELIHPEDHNKTKKEISNLLIGNATSNFENRFISRDGSIKHFEWTVTPLPAKKLMYCIGREISDRKLAEEKNKESEKRWKVIVEQTIFGCAISQNNRVKFINQAYADIVGYSIEEIMSWEPGEMFKIIHPEDRLHVKQQVQKKEQNIAGYITQYSYRTIQKNNEIRSVSINSQHVIYKGKGANLVFAVDITEHIQSEEQFKRQSLDLRFLNSIAISLADKPDDSGFSKTLLKGVQNHTNALAAVFSLYDRDKKALITKHFEASSSDIQKIVNIAGKKILNIASPVDDEAYALITKNAIGISYNFVDLTFGAIPKIIDKALRVATGISRIYGIGHFIDGQLYGTSTLSFKKDQEKPSMEMLESYAYLMAVYIRNSSDARALKESEYRFRLLAESAKDMIYRMSIPDAVYEYVSPASLKIFGYTPEEFYNKPLLIEKLIHPDWTKYFKKEWQNLLAGNMPPFYEYQIVHKSGEVKWLNQRNTLVKDEKGNPIAIEGAVTDVTNRKQMEIELIKSKEKAEESQANRTAILEGTKSSIWAFNKNYEILYINHAFQDEFLKSFDVLLKPGVNLVEALPKTLQPLWKPRYDKVLANNQFTVEDAVPTENGMLYIKVTFNPIVKNGEVIGGSCFGSNITERKQSELELIHTKEKIEESEKSYISLFNSATEAIYLQNEDGTFITVNEGAVRMYGYAREEFVGHSPEMVSAPNKNDLAQVATLLKRVYETGKTEKFDFWGKRKNGEIFPKEVISTRINYYGKNIIISSARDISDRKQIETELLKAKEKAEESDRLKSAFLANMSHEIRTPMNGILGFAELLKDTHLTDEKQQDYISIIEKSGTRMLNIINDIVNISKIESGQMKVNTQESNINEQIEYIYTFFRPEVEGKKLQFSLKNSLPLKEATLKTDREKVYAILTNLVKNAIKYTDQGFIEIGYNTQEKSIEIYVKDTGIGIAGNRQKAIFERFIQADITDKMAKQGAGLGLSISKAYVEMLGGKIWVESEIGKGSTFYFTLPYLTETKEEKSSKNESLLPEEIIPINKLKILIVEDDEPSEMLISIAVKKLANEIISAKTGTDAVETCRNNPDIDVILMDIQLPQINGYEATKQIREFNKNAIIIAETAYALEGEKDQAIAAGCNDYISKPIIAHELRQMIIKHMNKDK